MATQFDGNGMNNILIGTWADDIFDGQAGADTMSGGGGNDLYIVDNVGDVVRETPDFHIFDNTLMALMSADANGVGGGAPSSAPAISGTGAAVVFFSQANNLYDNFSPLNHELVLKFADLGSAVALHTTSANELAAPGPKAEIEITPDMHYVVFTSGATNLAAGDTHANEDIFVKDVISGEVTWESAAGPGGQSAFGRIEPTISDDGRYVAFTSLDNLLAADLNGQSNTDVFLRDRQSGTLYLVSGQEDGSAQGVTDGGADSDSSRPSIAVVPDTGVVVVAFESAAGHLPGVTDTNNVKDIYLKQLGELNLVNLTEQISINLSGVSANGPSSGAALTSDGHFIVFSSSSTTFITHDTNGSADLFEFDLLSGNFFLVSASAAGEQANQGAFNGDVSADGRFVVFESRATNLVSIANDSNAITKVFVKDMVTGDIEVVSRTSAGQFDRGFSANDAHISDDGRFIVFATAAPLTGNDATAGSDVYRVPNPLYSPADEVHASVSYTLPGGVEILLLTGANAINGAGNALDNLITGNDAGNALVGGAGNDVLHGLGGADVLSGDAGDDVLDGGGGSDMASYSSAAARVSVNLGVLTAQNTGGAGHDILSGLENLLGSRFNDVLTGDEFANRLSGAAGNDSLSGGAGKDVLIGGAGRDVLVGGAGADRFQFDRYSDTGLKASTADTIRGFLHAEGDRIDLSAIDARSSTKAGDAFRFIGNHAFNSHDASGQLHFDAAHHILYGSTDADSAPEFAINLPGVNVLVAADIIL